MTIFSDNEIMMTSKKLKLIIIYDIDAVMNLMVKLNYS